MTEGKQESVVTTEKPSVTTEAQPGASSSTVVQSFFRAKLMAIKDKQVQQDQKMDKATAQLQ